MRRRGCNGARTKGTKAQSVIDARKAHAHKMMIIVSYGIFVAMVQIQPYAYGLVQHALFPTLPNVTEPLMLNTLNLRCNSKDAASSTFNQTVLKSRWVTCQTDLILDQVGFDKPVRCEKDLKGGGTIVSHCFTPRKASKCFLTVNVTQDPSIFKCEIQPEYCKGQTKITGWNHSDGGSHMIPSKDLLVVVAKTYQKQALQSSNSIQCHGEFITSDNLVFSIESRNALTFKQSRAKKRQNRPHSIHKSQGQRLEIVENHLQTYPKNVELICKLNPASGSEIIHWFRNGIRFQQQTSSNVIKVGKDDDAWFQCIVFDGQIVVGNAMHRLSSDSGIRTRWERDEAGGGSKSGKRMPYFIFVSPDQRISPGGSAKLKCIAAGNPLPRLTWMLNGKVLSSIVGEDDLNNGNSSLDLRLRSVEPIQSGLYSCIADNVFGEVKTTLRIDVDGPPFIREMTSPRSFQAASHSEWLHCPYGGFPIDKIAWDKDGESLPFNERQIVFENGTLLLNTILPSDGGSYTCSVTQGLRTVTRTAIVEVVVPPRIEPFDFPSKLQEGWRTRVTCAAHIGDLPLRFQWFFNGQKLHANDDMFIIMSADAFSSSLSFANLRTSHSGNYTCEASNAASSDKYSAHLLVNVPPKWKSIPEDTHVRSGSSLLIKCQASGVPLPRIIWKMAEKNAENPLKSRFNEIPTNNESNLKLMANGGLMISKANESHEGEYLCQANNGLGPGISKLFSIHVDVPPRFSMANTTQTTTLKEKSISIKCLVIGDRPLNVSWRRNGKDLGHLPYHQFSVTEQMLPNGLLSSLVLERPVRRDDTAIFECIAANGFGVNKTEINFIVQEVPGSPETFQMVTHTSRQVNLSWTRPVFDGNSPILGYNLEFQRLDNNGQTESKMVGNRSFAQVSDLLPNTLYGVTIAAVNSVGTSEKSKSFKFKTDPEPPEGQVTQVEVYSESSQSLVVTWKPPHPDLQHGTILTYSIGYRLANSTEPFRYVSVDARDPNIKLKRRIDQLKTYSKYAVVVQAFNQVGAGPKSSPVLVMTSEDVPSAPPNNVQCFAQSSRSLYITWSPPRPEDQNGILVEYTVFYRPLILWQEKAEMLETQTLDQKITLEGLKCHQNYSIQVVAATKVGKGLKSRSTYCRTKEDLPGPPVNIKALPLDRNSIMISWLPPSQPNGEILGYSLYMKTMEKGRQFAQDFSLGSHINYYTMSGLHQAQPYSFWVSAFTLAGEGQVSDIVAETPLVSIPAGIASFSQKVIRALKESVEMKCITVGIPAPTQHWTKNGVPITQSEAGSRLYLEDNGVKLRLERLELIDAANYTCQASNMYGLDSITYQLVVKLSRNNGVPPAPPSELKVTSVARSSVTLSWPPSQIDGGSPVMGYRLHYHRQFGDWNRVDVASSILSHTLHNLRCGTIYQYFMEAINEFGVGERTDTITLPTQGTPPVAPVSSSFGGLLSVNATSIDLNLAAWGSGGCDISSFVIEYSSSKTDEKSDTNWILVNNNVRPGDLINGQHYIVLDLKPSTKYTLRITAHNSAGSTVKEYRFSTLGGDGSKIASEELLIVNKAQAWNSLVSMLIFLPIMAFLLVVSLVLCVQRGRRITHGLSEIAGTTKHHTRTSKEANKNDRGHGNNGRRGNEPDLTDGLSDCSVENAYEMSDVAASTNAAADLNYGFGAFLNVHQTFIGDGAAISTSSPKRPRKLNEPASEATAMAAENGYHYIVQGNPYSTIHWHHHHRHPSQYSHHLYSSLRRGEPRSKTTKIMRSIHDTGEDFRR